MKDISLSKRSIDLDNSISTIPPKGDIEIAAWRPSAAFSSNDHLTDLTQPHHAQPSRLSPISSSHPKADLDIPDGVSAYTQNDRGYAAAIEVFNSLTPGSEARPKSSEDDFTGIGSHFFPRDTNENDTPILTYMDLEVSKCLVNYAGHEDGPNWLPVSDLLRIFNRASVLQALEEALSGETLPDTACMTVQEYASKICPDPDRNDIIGSRSVFAILTHLGRVREIWQFLDRNLTDDDLPLIRRPEIKNLTGQLYPKRLSAGELECWNFGSHWRSSDWTAFDTYQKKMRSPFFLLHDTSRRIPHYDLESGTVLPFIKDYGPKELTLQSQVRCVQIHPGHFKICKDNREKAPFFAVKKLSSEQIKSEYSRERIFREEVKALTKVVSHSSHDHVIRLLATWKQGDTWSMLFPWAKSNLKEYWWGEDPINTTKSVQWLASQCRGLAEGLQKIHRSPSEHATDFAIHGDIKPENILLFVNETHPDGILVISDFGFTRFHGRDTRSNRLAIGSSPTNRAPEIDLKHPISRLYDIWALGCVFVEFITWHLTGKAGMEAFMNRRIEDDVGELKIKYDKFFNIRVGSDGKNEPEVKHAVNEWINELRKERHCSQYFQDFLTFILQYMLSVDPKGRAKCDKVATELRTLESACAMNGKDYLLGQGGPKGQSATRSEAALPHRQAEQTDLGSVVQPTQHVTRAQEHNEIWGPWSERWSNASEPLCERRGSMTNIAAILPPEVAKSSGARMGTQIMSASVLQTKVSATDTETTPLILDSSRFQTSQSQPRPLYLAIDRHTKALPHLGARFENRRQTTPYRHGAAAESEESRELDASAKAQNIPRDKSNDGIEPHTNPSHIREGDSFVVKAMLRWCFPCAKP